MAVRLPESWFDDTRNVEHSSQGDIHLGITQRFTRFIPGEDRIGKRQREAIEPAFMEFDLPVVRPVLVCSHDCTYVAQPEGTRGYAHPYRIVAPIVPFEDLASRPDGSAGINRDSLAALPRSGYASGLLYLPRRRELELGEPPDEWSDHCAVALYRSYLTSQSALDATAPPALRLSSDALRWLHRGLIHTMTGNLFDPSELREPDVSDSWNH